MEVEKEGVMEMENFKSMVERNEGIDDQFNIFLFSLSVKKIVFIFPP